LNKKILTLAVAFVFLAAASGFCQEILSAEKFFDGVSAEYGKVNDYTANVTITEGKNDPWRGRLSYKSPVYLRIDFDVPKGQVLVMDGEKLTIYVPGLDVVLVQRFKRKSPSVLAAMASKQGLNMLRTNYGVAFNSTPGFVPLEEGSREQVTMLRLTPKSSGAPFNEIILSIGKDNLIRRMDALQSNGSRLVLDLTGVKYNQSIPDARFEYDPPPVANVQDDFLFNSSE
jgi:outer membrane lipoprotein-sorting protein